MAHGPPKVCDQIAVFFGIFVPLNDDIVVYLEKFSILLFRFVSQK